MHSIWYHHTQTSEWSKITKIQSYKYEHIVVKFELGRYKLDVVGVQKVRWDKGGTVREGDYVFIYGKGNDNHQ